MHGNDGMQFIVLTILAESVADICSPISGAVGVGCSKGGGGWNAGSGISEGCNYST